MQRLQLFDLQNLMTGSGRTVRPIVTGWLCVSSRAYALRDIDRSLPGLRHRVYAARPAQVDRVKSASSWFTDQLGYANAYPLHFRFQRVKGCAT